MPKSNPQGFQSGKNCFKKKNVHGNSGKTFPLLHKKV